MPKVTYIPSKGLFQTNIGEGVSIQADTSKDGVASLDVTRNVTLRASPTTGISEVSGSLLIMKGRAEGLFFHVGGNQYVSSNAWYDGATETWKYETADSSAFRWGFRGSGGCFDLDWAIQSEAAGQVTSGSIVEYSNMPSWGTSLSVSASLGAVTVGKKADRSKTNYTPVGGGAADRVFNGANATFDVTGSVKASSSARALAVAVTGSVELGCGAPDAFFLLPRLNTTQRNALTAVNGMVIYNTEDGKFQGYQAGSWQNLIA